jgi:hypothetical protein
MRAAAGQAGDGAPEAPDSREIPLTIRALVVKTPGAPADQEGQIVAARFIRDREIAAGLAPLWAVRQNAPPTRAELGQQMGQLMPQRALELFCAVLHQSRIERDQGTTGIGPAGAGLQTRIPFHPDKRSKPHCSGGAEDFARGPFKVGVACELL